MGRVSTRTKVSLTLDANVMAAVHAYVNATPSTQVSTVVDEALKLWLAKQQDDAMAAQFDAQQSPIEQSERRTWKDIQADAAKQVFGRSPR